MGAFPTERWFRLSDEGVRCDENGLFVGGAAVLVRSPACGGGWAVRPAAELDRDLGARYGFLIDAAAKRAGFAGVAGALERGELALAQFRRCCCVFPIQRRWPRAFPLAAPPNSPR